jgi:hypothetical protein
VSKAGAAGGGWPLDRDCLSRRCWGGHDVQERARVRGVARFGASAALDGRQAAVAGDQQAGRPLPPEVAHPWGPGGRPDGRGQAGRAEPLAPGPHRPAGKKSGGGGPGE